ncbi:MAG: hypothetical protein EBY28_09560 [Betaproteobacteria bacterium]|nr:hypothetical protein [Betaproteobacteria bacterium]
MSLSFAHVGLNRPLSGARRSRLDPFKRLAAAPKQPFGNVIRSMLNDQSNAFVEGLSGVLYQAKRAPRGCVTATPISPSRTWGLAS